MKKRAQSEEPETVVLLDVQRCSKCGQDRLPVIENLDEPGEKKICSWCGAENSFSTN